MVKRHMLERDMLSITPVWAPSLHLKFWPRAIISKLAIVGTQQFKSTASEDRLSYGRCFIQIAASKPLPKSVTLDTEEGEIIEEHIEFEWVPPVCKKCYTFGHQGSHCPTR